MTSLRTGRGMVSGQDSWRRRASVGAVSGLAGGAAFAVAQEIDLRLLRYPTDDYLLLGGLSGRRGPTARRIGMALHAANSVAVGAVYGLSAANVSRLPGPVKGIVFAMIENAILYPAFLFEDRHPLIESGDLPSYRTGIAFTQEVLRHLAFGAATGAAFERLHDR